MNTLDILLSKVSHSQYILCNVLVRDKWYLEVSVSPGNNTKFCVI
jgi:hypothetical protein